MLQSIRHEPTRRESLLAWALLVHALALRGEGEALADPAFEKNGKPYYPDRPWRFNLSHTDDLVCAAISAQGEVGVDAQTISEPSERIIRRVLTENEQALLAQSENKACFFTRLWTEKEAFVKFTGEGLSHSFQTLDFSLFCGRDSFEAFGAYFSCFSVENAILTLCLETPSRICPLWVTQPQLEQTLRGCADFETERGVFE